jgi:hypothetical protein
MLHALISGKKDNTHTDVFTDKQMYRLAVKPLPYLG